MHMLRMAVPSMCESTVTRGEAGVHRALSLTAACVDCCINILRVVTVKSMLQAQAQVRNHPMYFCLFSWFCFVVLLKPKLTLTVKGLLNTWDLTPPPFLNANIFIIKFLVQQNYCFKQKTHKTSVTP